MEGTTVGPVGIGAELVEMMVDVGAAVVVVEELTGAVLLSMYMFNRLPPPQYSVLFPLQTMLQPVVAGSDPGTNAEPAAKVLPA